MKLDRLWQWLEQFRVVREGFTFASEMGKRSIGTNAACISFYFFISIIPFSILLCSQLPFTGITSEALIEAATRLTPDSVDSLVNSIITEAYTSRVGLFSVSLLALLWSSSKVVTAVIRSLDTIYREDDRRNYFVITGKSLLYTAIMLIGAGVVLLLSSRRQTAEEFLLNLFPSQKVAQTVSEHWNHLLVLLLGVLFFALLYTVFPAGKRSFLHQLPGAMLAGMGIALFSGFFAYYNTRRNVYRSFYGSLASIAIFLIWLYACVNIFLLGAVLNAHYADNIRRLFHRSRKPNQ